MHSTYGKAWSAFATLLEMINQGVAIFCGDAQALNDNFGYAVLEEEKSERLADALGLGGKGLVLQTMGSLLSGRQSTKWRICLPCWKRVARSRSR